MKKSILKNLFCYSEDGFTFYQLNSHGYTVRFILGESIPESKNNRSRIPLNSWDRSEKCNANLKCYLEVLNQDEILVFSRIEADNHDPIGSKLERLFPFPATIFSDENYRFKEASPEKFEVNLMIINKNTQVSGHDHPVDVQIFVIEGTYSIDMEGSIKSYSPGDSFKIKKGVYHEVSTNEKTTVIEIWDGVNFW